MNVDKVAVVYARALLEAAVEKNVLDDVLGDAAAFEEALRRDADVWRFLVNPRVERSAKRNALTAALGGKSSEIFLNFLFLLIDKGRLVLLRDMLSAFRALYDEKAGIVRAEAVSAVPIPEDTLGELTHKLATELGKRVIVTNRVAPEILGGLVVRFDGRVADGSLRTALEEIRDEMIELKFGSELVHEN